MDERNSAKDLEAYVPGLYRKFASEFPVHPEYPVGFWTGISGSQRQKTVSFGKGYKYPFTYLQPAKLSLSLSSTIRKASSTRISLYIHPNLLIFGDLEEKT